MNEITLASFRAKLEEMRFVMVDAMKIKYKKDNQNEQMADIADDAAQSYDRQLRMESGEHDWKKLRLVEEAIKKIDSGQYGICLECKAPIPEARLSVIPFTAHCIGCLEFIEKKNI